MIVQVPTEALYEVKDGAISINGKERKVVNLVKDVAVVGGLTMSGPLTACYQNTCQMLRQYARPPKKTI